MGKKENGVEHIGMVRYGLTMLVVSAMAFAAAPPNGNAQKVIGITLVNKVGRKPSVPRPNAAVFLAYYDPVKREWHKSSKQTDANGRCSFLVPSGEEGESYPFLYAVTQSEMDAAVKEASEHRRLVWRIPPGEQQDLELMIDGKQASNTSGSMQLWQVPR
jgi:hypothetical protein